MSDNNQKDAGSSESGHQKRKSLGGYELLSKLGKGGMGTVYKARQTSMDRIIALKILPPRLSRDEKFVERFLREARSAGKLSHSNIVSGFDVGEAEGYHYFAMEYVEGETLLELLKREGSLDEPQTVEIAIQITKGLAHAHAHGLVHRDIKPGNVIIAKDGTVKLCDLGLARSTEEDQSLTAIGTALGTPHYISPEQIEGQTHIDGRVDLYALGATLYHMVAGAPPFAEPTGGRVMSLHLCERPPPLSKTATEVSSALARVIIGFRST
jgi:serine/threonine-protein kinase